MQPPLHPPMSNFSPSLPHSTPPTRASWLPSSSASHHQPNCMASHPSPGQSASPETTMVDFDLLLTNTPPHCLYPYRPVPAEHEGAAVDSLGSFNSVLHKGSFGVYSRSTQRQAQGQGVEQRTYQGTHYQVEHLPLLRSQQTTSQEGPKGRRSSAAKPPTAPKEVTPRSSDQINKTRAEIRRARAARNRSSARRSRLKKKAENQQHMEKACYVQRQNEALKQRVVELREKMLSLQKIVNGFGMSDVQNDGSIEGTGSDIETSRKDR